MDGAGRATGRSGTDGQAPGGRAHVRRGGPVAPPAHPPGLSSVLERNIQALHRRRREEERRAGLQEKVAEAITRFTGSMLFVYLHLAFFGFWIVANLGWIPGVPKWDESFVVLAMWASVEAIFLSTFVLISQNRMQAQADKRADLDLQISLLAEHEVTKLVTMVSALTNHFGIRTDADDELHEITQDVAPDAVLDEIEATRPEG
ncbi:MAG TPA: DUF1003 domain-containing protein [Azospirillaceae bacterium]|nr:DUF1003 domain-containing protein [Azospirillaceae bacterium]